MNLEFKEKQFDGPYEVVGLDITYQGEVFKGVVYYPPVKFQEPHPVILFFHGFPQLFTLPEVIKKYVYLLDKGYAFVAFNFRGYRYSQGCVSITSQVNDALEVIDFVKQLHEHGKFDINDVNIISEDFGAYIALILASKVDLINRLLLISPIIDLMRHVNEENFPKMLEYINRFLPGNVNGVNNVNAFIEMTKNELSCTEYQIDKIQDKVKAKNLKIISGDLDKVTPISEIETFAEKLVIPYQISILEGFDHDLAYDAELEEIQKEVEDFF